MNRFLLCIVALLILTITSCDVGSNVSIDFRGNSAKNKYKDFPYSKYDYSKMYCAAMLVEPDSKTSVIIVPKGFKVNTEGLKDHLIISNENEIRLYIVNYSTGENFINRLYILQNEPIVK